MTILWCTLNVSPGV